MNTKALLGLILLAGLAVTLEAFTVHPNVNGRLNTLASSHARNGVMLSRIGRFTIPSTAAPMAKDDGVVELVDDDEQTKTASPETTSPQNTAAPFLSQGEISEEALNPDLSDPKQTRVIIYIILSLVPVLFLIPLMLGSRDLIPLDALPPVEM